MKLDYHVYILEFDEGGYYVGLTNSPSARIAEHSLGVGADETRGKSFRVRLMQKVGERSEAEYVEPRIRKALKRAKPHLDATALENLARICVDAQPEKKTNAVKPVKVCELCGEVMTYLTTITRPSHYCCFWANRFRLPVCKDKDMGITHGHCHSCGKRTGRARKSANSNSAGYYKTCHECYMREAPVAHLF